MEWREAAPGPERSGMDWVWQSWRSVQRADLVAKKIEASKKAGEAGSPAFDEMIGGVQSEQRPSRSMPSLTASASQNVGSESVTMT